MTNVDKILHEVPHIDPIGLAVMHGEEAARGIEGITGADKRAAVTELIVSGLRLPFVPQWLMRFVIGAAVDRVVAEFNARQGHGWGHK